MKNMLTIIRNVFKNIIYIIAALRRPISLSYISDVFYKVDISDKTKIYSPSHLRNVKIGYGSYISQNAWVSETLIGKFCSVGPNFLCGWGIHPTNALSTSPMFYSTLKQNGFTLSEENKIEERQQISIGSDVFIGANVVVLDGVKIGDGAIIAAGAVVSNNVEPYSIVGGVPAKLIKYRFEPQIIEKLLLIKWWDWDTEKLKIIEQNTFSVDEFVKKYAE